MGQIMCHLCEEDVGHQELNLIDEIGEWVGDLISPPPSTTELTPTSTQYWSFARDRMFMTASKDPKNVVKVWEPVNPDQEEQVAEAWALWDDVSGFTAIKIDDEVAKARAASTWVPDDFLGIEYER